MRANTKKLTLLSIMCAAAMVLSFVETLFPPIYPAVPGIKMGLPNIIIIFTLYKFSLKSAAAVSLIRVFAVSLLFGNPMTFVYSLAGAVLSLTIMAILKKIDIFSTVGVSVAGAVFHNLGQIIMAIFVMQTIQIGYYMIILSISGIFAGILIGLTAAILLKRTEKSKIC